MRKTIIYISLLLLCLTDFAFSQSFRTRGRQREENYFAVDYALFRANPTEKNTRLEIYYQIFNVALNFEEYDDFYEAEYEIDIKVYDNDKNVVDSYQHNQKVRVPTQQKSVSRTDFRTNQVNFTIPEGKYEVKVFLRDMINNSNVEEKIKFKTEKYKNKDPLLSDIQLVQAVALKSDDVSVFDKGDLRLIPSVRHKYGHDESMNLYYYIELYQGKEKSEDVLVETVLRHRGKGMLYRDSLTTFFDAKIVRQFREISMADLRPGQYELIITLKGRRGKKIDVQSKEFEMVWTPQSLIRFDFDVIVSQIKLIAESEEVKILEDKETYEERVAAFNEFWELKDPTPGTYENETKREFYRRVAVANSNFSYTFNNGWRSDRGRIYILFGEPDQVDDYPIVPDQRPYQEWHYYRGTAYRKFVFVDLNEDGDYRLVYPYDGLFQRPDF